MFGIPFSDTFFHIFPKIIKKLMVPFLAELVHIDEWPVHVVHINILNLHKSKGLFKLQDRIEILMWESLCSDEKFLSLASALLDHSIDGVTEWDLVVVEHCCVNMSDTDFETLFKKGY